MMTTIANHGLILRALIEGVRASRAVAPDETGWRINGQKAWLWAFAGEEVTVYLIAFGRGYEHAAEVLGEDYSGVLERDGWAPYRRFTGARHQTCHAHLLRRTSELIADSIAGQARVPHAVRRILNYPAGHDERDPHRPPTEHRPARTDDQRATRPPARASPTTLAA